MSSRWASQVLKMSDWRRYKRKPHHEVRLAIVVSMAERPKPIPGAPEPASESFPPEESPDGIDFTLIRWTLRFPGVPAPIRRQPQQGE